MPKSKGMEAFEQSIFWIDDSSFRAGKYHSEPKSRQRCAAQFDGLFEQDEATTILSVLSKPSSRLTAKVDPYALVHISLKSCAASITTLPLPSFSSNTNPPK